MPELELATLDEMADELERRGHACVIGIIRDHRIEAEATTVDFRWRGGGATVIGLARIVASFIERTVMQTTERETR